MSRPRRWVQARATATLTAATALCLLAGSLGQVAQAAPPVPAAVAAAPAAQEAPQTAFDQQMVGLINGARTQAGLSAVSAAAGLTQLSVDWSTTMADGKTGYVLKHNPDAWTQLPNYGAASRTSWAENVASWTSGAYSAQDIFTSYMNSPGHRANIMNPAFRFVGVGTVSGGNGSDYNTMTFTDKVDSTGGGSTTNPAPTTPAVDPVPAGSWDAGSLDGIAYTVQGWTLDRDRLTSPLNVDIYDQRPDGTRVGVRITADAQRGDVASVYPGAGDRHGFSGTVSLVGTGRHSVCVYAINQGAGTVNPSLGCKDVDVAGPTGSLDLAAASAPGTLQVAGWAADPAVRTGSTEVHVYVTGPQGTKGISTRTTGARADVQRAVPWASPTTGFTATVPTMGEGANQVCVYAINQNQGGNPQFGCSTVQVRNAFGSLDAVWQENGKIVAAGWALNPTRPGEQVPVHVYVTSSTSRGYAGSAGNPRADVGGAFPGYGNNHGYAITVPTNGSGRQQVCAYAVPTVGGTGNVSLGCRDLVVP
ncbi:CAP domain-containing protein [Nakamurella flavida]|uniref:CAP domain-containing protein n=1 Tax=Nakamurella flavida TaxID=363630 RepID=A0A938YIV6_9ACTN|nr:CAP domain-containing protein [Nakamurella flavida]MBM9478505.1 CAP domain-containing protein [Nakamurella flavida]MDP9777669.1 uncharacterized protein YkwD [Nakamurella flavida]